ncbi:MAG: hypothetical protein FJZ79_04990 [Chlorobi bacterium]|nr:hypothetical protein [Chlorobiota bacterium]
MTDPSRPFFFETSDAYFPETGRCRSGWPLPERGPEKGRDTGQAIDMIMPYVFLYEISWWLLLGAAIVAAAVPSLLRPFRKVTSILAAALWASATSLMWLHHGAATALAGALVSLCTGIVVFVVTIFFSGLDLMAKRRYR